MGLTLSKRAELFQALVCSKLLYGAESWIVTEEGTVKYFHAAVIRLYRRLLCLSPEAHVSDGAVLAQVGLPAPAELLRRARLRYLATLLHCGDRHEWGLLHADSDWIACLETDLSWVWTQLKHSSSLQDPTQHWPQWEDLIVHHRSYWRRLVRRSFERAALQRRNRWHVQDFHQRMLPQFRLIFDYEQPVEDEPLLEEPESLAFGCLTCQRRCRNRAGEAAHMFKVYAHLCYSDRCRRILQSRNMGCPVVPGTGSSEDRDRTHQHDSLLPPLQAEGPMPPLPRLRDDLEIDADLHVAFVDAFLDGETFDQVSEALGALATSRPLSWTIGGGPIPSSLRTWSRLTWIGGRCRLTRRVAHLAYLPTQRLGIWLRYQDPTPTSLEKLEHECSRIAATDWSGRPTSSVPPMRFGRHRVLLHVYSGRCRVGDVQFFLDKMDPPSGIILHVVSRDIVVDSEWGSAMSLLIEEYWLSAARRGHGVAFLAGPPCETWFHPVVRLVFFVTAKPGAARALPDWHRQYPVDFYPGACLCNGANWRPDRASCRRTKSPRSFCPPNQQLAQDSSCGSGEKACSFGSYGLERPNHRRSAATSRLCAPGVHRQYGAPTPKPTDLLVVNLPR
eukprot:s1055_g15.t1